MQLNKQKISKYDSSPDIIANTATSKALFELIQTHWQDHQTELMMIRQQVFINEQQVPVELEWDEFDQQACHMLARLTLEHTKQAVGTARIVIHQQIAHLGRMAVLKQYRGQGIGQAILAAAISYCRQTQAEKIILNAQLSALGFYQQAGFDISSEQFFDANIAHKQMTLILPK